MSGVINSQCMKGNSIKAESEQSGKDNEKDNLHLAK